MAVDPNPDPGPAPDPYTAGLNALESGDYQAAFQHFTTAVDEDGSAWEPRYARAYSILVDTDLRDDIDLVDLACADLDRMLVASPTASDAASLRGWAAALRSEHEMAVRYFLMAASRSTLREAVEPRLVDALAELLTRVEEGRCPAAEDIELCDRLEQMITVSAFPTPVRNDLLAEVLAARAFRRQTEGDDHGALVDLTALARLVPQHPRLPRDLPVTEETTMSSPSGDPVFATVGGMGGGGSFTSELEKIFDLYFGDQDTDATRERIAEFGQVPSRSVLLFGPSGCGKTYVVRAFAGEYRRRHGQSLPLIRLRLNEIFGRYVGDSEQRLAEMFDRAIATQPSVVFCDEIDGLGMTREGAQGWHQELTGHFLQQIDRLKEENAAVLFFGCTNRIWSVDLALLRRFDRLLPVGLPDEDARREVFQVHLAPVAKRLISPDVDVAELARKSHGLTPGDIQKVVSQAADDLLISPGPHDGQLDQGRLVAALRDHRSPMHVQEWVRQSLVALNEIGQEDMARDLDRLYGPHITGATARNGMIPFDAWTEEPELDLSLLRRFTWSM